jgi:hypothetical protein
MSTKDIIEEDNIVVVSFSDGKQEVKVTITNDIRIETEFIPEIRKDAEAEGAVKYALFLVNKLIGYSTN